MGSTMMAESPWAAPESTLAMATSQIGQALDPILDLPG
jgi:hypothetical protein